MQSESKSSGQWLVASGQLKNAQAKSSSSRVSDLQPPASSLDLSSPTPNPQPLTPRRSRRLAFTLTELLVVIAIIAVLAAMVSVGVMRALDTAKQTRIKTEVDQLDAAFKSYREKYGSFPPSLEGLAGSNVLIQHIARAFPRYNISNLGLDLRAAGLDPKPRPDQALVFWLKGFSPDPANPFVTPAGAQIIAGNVATPNVKVAVTPLFDFDQARLYPVDTTPPIPMPNKVYGISPSYFPQGTKADETGAPYIYWPSVSYPAILPEPPGGMGRAVWNDGGNPFTQPVFANAGPIMPYANDVNGDGSFDINGDGVVDNGEGWANPDSFQIISAGMDGKYGRVSPTIRTDRARLYPTGTFYDPAGTDDDNVTNFCPKARLGDAKP
jgi:prepilin-type N-terminal cleavage/methylation domain-containing protein